MLKASLILSQIELEIEYLGYVNVKIMVTSAQIYQNISEIYLCDSFDNYNIYFKIIVFLSRPICSFN